MAAQVARIPMTPWLKHRLWKECGSKRKFDREGEAKRVAHSYGQRAYFCPQCKGWHLTKKDSQ